MAELYVVNSDAATDTAPPCERQTGGSSAKADNAHWALSHTSSATQSKILQWYIVKKELITYMAPPNIAEYPFSITKRWVVRLQPFDTSMMRENPWASRVAPLKELLSDRLIGASQTRGAPLKAK
jgi:hypothetical protein